MAHSFIFFSSHCGLPLSLGCEVHFFVILQVDAVKYQPMFLKQDAQSGDV